MKDSETKKIAPDCGVVGHTPGPWKISGVSMETGSISIGHAEQRIVIADVTNAASFGDFIVDAMKRGGGFGSPDAAKTQWANARLIAAAPDLLAALKVARKFITDDRGQEPAVQTLDRFYQRNVLEKIDAALSKSELAP